MNESQFQSELQTLRYQNRMILRLTSAVAVALVILVAAGANAVNDMIVESKELVLKDDDGTVRYRLFIDDKSTLVEQRFDEKGKKRTSRSVFSSGVLEEIFNPQEERTVAYLVDKNERAIHAHFQKGKMRHQLFIENDGTCANVTYDSDGKARLVKGVNEEGLPSIAMQSETGHRIMNLKPTSFSMTPKDSSSISLAVDEKAAVQRLVSKDQKTTSLSAAFDGIALSSLRCDGGTSVDTTVQNERADVKFKDGETIRLQSSFVKNDLALITVNDNESDQKVVLAAREKDLGQITISGNEKESLNMVVGNSTTSIEFSDKMGVSRMKTLVTHEKNTEQDTAAIFLKDAKGKICSGNIVTGDGISELQFLKDEKEALILDTRPDNGAQARFYDVRPNASDEKPRLRLGVLGDSALCQFADEKGRVRLTHFESTGTAGTVHYDLNDKPRLVEISESNGELGQSLLDSSGNARLSANLSSTGQFSFYREKSSSETAWDAANVAGTILQILDTASKFRGK